MIHSFWVANFVHALFLCAAVKRKFSSLGSKLPVAKLATGVSAGLQNWIMVECRRATLTETKKISRKKSVWQPGNHDHVFLRICTTIACFTPKSQKKRGRCGRQHLLLNNPFFIPFSPKKFWCKKRILQLFFANETRVLPFVLAWCHLLWWSFVPLV